MGRLRKPPSERYYNVQALQERHHQMIRLSLLGKQPSEIAEILGVTKDNVCQVLGSQLAQDKLAVLRVATDCKSVDIAHFLAEEAPKCLELLRQARDGDKKLVAALDETPQISLKERLHAAESLLDRHGTSRIQNIRGLVGHAVITDDLLEEIKQKAAEAKERARCAGNLVEMPVKAAI